MNKTKGSTEGSEKEAGQYHNHKCLGTCYSSSWHGGRSYGCSFCKREFKSAQALGGHMNVHRRDRARLRSSSSSCLNNNPPDSTPKPNPAIRSNYNPITHLSISPSSSNLCYNSPSSYSNISATSGDKKPRLAISSHDQNRQVKMLSSKNTIDEGLKGCALLLEEDEHKVFKNYKINSGQHNNNNNNITLELGIGLLKHPNDKNKLDLELRLGH